MAPPEKKRRNYIRYTADSYLKDKFLAARTRNRTTCGCSSEGCVRTLNCLRFCIVCSASLFHVLAPWVLCLVEVIAVLLIYLLGTSRSLIIHEQPATYHFSYMHSLEDVVGLSCTRSALLSIAYAVGMHHTHRPYLYASYLLAAACFPYLLVKMILFRYSQDPMAAAAIFIITGLFCWVHVFASRRTVEWARRRYQMGLAGFGYPWEEGEEAWSILRRAPDLEAMTKNSDGGDEEVSPETLADDDSRFLEVGPLRVHYKEVVPATVVGGANDRTGIVLVHGFGGGVFAWRHIMEPLAIQCQCRVIAFDRPAFGLTSRPPPPSADQDNPYAMGAQAQLLLTLAGMLGLERVILAAHADGCLLALRAASLAASVLRPPKEQGPGSLSPCSSGRMEHRLSGSQQQPGVATGGAGQQGGDLSPDGVSGTNGGGVGGGGIHGLSESALAALGLESRQQHSDGSGLTSHDSLASAPVVSGSGPAAAGGGATGGWSGEDAGSFSGGYMEVTGAVGSGEAQEHSSTTSLSACIGITEGTRHRRAQSMPGPFLLSGGRMHHSAGPHASAVQVPVQGAPWPEVIGLALLHPNLTGQMGPALSRLLSRSKVGRSILRPLLRTEVGEVANRRAWHNADKLTPEIMSLYKTPLRVEGWCESLLETTRLRREQTQGNLSAYLCDARPLPALLLTGEHDKIAPPGRLEQLGTELPLSRGVVVHDCGHLSHEEAPGALLDQLQAFSAGVLRMMFRGENVEGGMARAGGGGANALVLGPSSARGLDLV